MMFIKRTENNWFTNWWLGVDKVVLSLVLSFIIFGVLMLFATTPYQAQRIRFSDYHFMKSVFMYVPIGITLMLGISFLKVRKIRYICCFSFVIFFILMLLTLFFHSVKGSSRWIFIGSHSIQPSEYLKPLFAVVVAMILVRIKDLHKKLDKKNIKTIWNNKKERNYILLLLFLLLSVFSILIFQPDMGMTFTFAVIIGVELLIAGLPRIWCSVLILLGSSGLFIAYNFMPHFASRINRFLTNDNEQLDFGLRAIQKSSFFFGGHSHNFKTAVPDIHTDFIFAAIVEEISPIIAMIIILMFLCFIIHIIYKFKNKDNLFIIISGIGIISYLTFQIMVNISSTLGIIPTKGMTLPFISYGGSSFISSCVAIGIILSLLQDQNLRR